MYTITASDRAKAVLLLIADRPPDVQLEIITGAIRGATEQAAQIVEQHSYMSLVASQLGLPKRFGQRSKHV